jgi:hypothetical protein
MFHQSVAFPEKQGGIFKLCILSITWQYKNYNFNNPQLQHKNK